MNKAGSGRGFPLSPPFFQEANRREWWVQQMTDRKLLNPPAARQRYNPGQLHN